MKQKGSITVFLALILALLLSFVLTALEAARIGAANAYVSMLSSLAGDSFLASYYFPLFEEYGLLGVDAGYKTTALLYSGVEGRLKEKVAYATDSLQKGLLSMEEPEIAVKAYGTLLSGEGAEFLRQVKQQVAYEGFRIALGQLFDKDILRDSVVAGEVYKRQEEVQQEAANTVAELLRLMELVDGVATGKQEIKFTKEGQPQTNRVFIKQLAPYSEAELREAFGNGQIFHALQDSFFYPQTAGSNVEAYLKEAISAKETLAWLSSSADAYEAAKEELLAGQRITERERAEWEEAAKEAKEAKEEERYEEAMQHIERCDAELLSMREEAAQLEAEIDRLWGRAMEEKESYRVAMQKARTGYEEIRKVTDAVIPLLKEAEEAVDALEKKQKAARACAFAYEVFLKEKESMLSSGLYGVFQEEMENLKLYLGMEERGYVPAVMKQSLTENYELLMGTKLPEFKEEEPEEMLYATEQFMEKIGSYQLKGLWFTYGDIKAGKDSGGHIMDTLAELLNAQVCGLAGVSKEEMSDLELSGTELPSASLGQQPLLASLAGGIARMTEVFSEKGVDEIGAMLSDTAGNALALELYLSEFFSDYRNPQEHRKLAYEREYILFGKKSDEGNLTQTVLSLVAFRSLFTMLALLQNTQKQAQLTSIAQAAAGVVGIPLLSVIIKYSLMLLWAVEEAFVETAALLDGKRIPLLSVEGTVSVGELFLFGAELVASKAKSMADGFKGAAYSDYLLLFSLLMGQTKKCYRAMDLIQENIRLRYRDSFRIRNVVTSLSFETETELTKRWFPELFFGGYQIRQKKEVLYE